ncbi:MAG: Hpt domain-containing protein, partial [Planctomycetota bacterium]|nr:Hpt domain-containing protein [Planctomycetota bacterium]
PTAARNAAREATVNIARSLSGKEETTAQVAALPVFNPVALRQRLLADMDLAKQTVAIFLTDMPQQIKALASFVASGNASGAARQAHAIKGAAASAGAERLGGLAAEMEQAAQQGNLDTIGERLDQMWQQLDLYKKAIASESWMPYNP